MYGHDNKQNETKTYIVRKQNTEYHLRSSIRRRTGMLAQKRNKEIQESTGVPRITKFVKAQRIKWYGYVMRKSNSECLKKRWLSGTSQGNDQEYIQKKRWIKQDLEKLEMPNWKKKYKIEKSGKRCRYGKNS